MTLAVWSDAQVLGQLNSGTKWSGSTITYAFPTTASGIYTGGGEGTGFIPLNANQQAAAELALTLWDDLIAPDMVKVAGGTSYTSANIEFGSSTTGVSYAHAYYPTTGSVWFNATYDSTTGGNDLVNPTIGRHGFLTYIHEIGHSLGLDHMGEYNGSQTSGPSCYQDSTVYSVMSYYGPSWGSGSGAGEGLVAWADWVGADGRLYSPQTPMLNDIMAIQTMYGVETTTRTGDTVYGFNSNVEGTVRSIFDFTLNKNPILTIFDSAGNDTLDLSGWNTPSTINLARGGFTSANSMTYNISIAYTCDIENAVGGGGADSITGNDLANVLSGGSGNDTILGLAGTDLLNGGAGNDRLDGGDGVDTVVFSAAWSTLGITYDAATMAVIFSGLAIGTDTVVNVEYYTDANNVTRSFSELTGSYSSGVSVAAVTGSVSEGNSGALSPNSLTFKVVLAVASSEVETVQWSLQPAIGAADAADFAGATAGTVTFAAGQTEALIELQVNGDTQYETDETVTVVLSSPSSGVFVAAGSALATVTNDDGAVLYGTDTANALTGTLVDDSLFGLGGNDTLTGSAGNDLLDGGLGSDNMVGGTGDDTYVVDSSRDRVTESAGGGIDTVRTTLASMTLGADVENLEYAGSATTAFRGVGNGLANVIKAGAGADTVNGGLGSDALWGLSGKDAFEFTTALGSSNVDTIMDFDVVNDVILLENAIFKAFGKATGALSAGAFNTGKAATEADDRIVYDTASGALWYDSDGTGSATAVRFATISLAGLNGTLTSADFAVI